ncbi:MAG: FG-GAP repeat protein [Flavobacteriales bacterium]|nr:FG-GAP repeat protein [Flavobacteriales bacterium]
MSTLAVAPSSNLFGCSVHTAGDVNGDGYSDVVVGARSGTNGQALEGLAFVYLGSTTGVVTPFLRQLEVNVAGANFGVSVAGAGDVNGDGYSEVIIGADQWESAVAETDEGAAFMFNGSASGTVAVATNTLQRNIAGGALGRSVAEAGDVNGDGYADVVVGSSLGESGELDEGLAYVFRGSPTGNSSAVVDILQPNFTGYEFGSAVSGGGDLDGDGYSDVLIGAPNAAPSLSSEGGAYWFRGNSARSLGRITRQYDADLVTPLSTNGMDFSQPDYFGIGHRARSPIHRCRTKLKWEVVFEGQPFTGAPITNSLLSTGTSAAWTTLPVAGVEIKQLIYKFPGVLRYKWRVRVEYDMAKLITGQRFSRWFYGYANSVGDIGVLPIELVEFTGWPEGRENVLHWTTATEDNSERFDVFRSRNGVDHELIGQLPAAGASQTMLSYLFNDPFPPSGTVYYQLNMVDRDGESERSPLIAITRGSEVVLYPDPADDAVTLSATSLVGVRRVTVIDGLGRIVLDQQLNLTEVGTPMTLSLNGLASGRYTVQLLDAQSAILDRVPFIKR